MKIEYLWLSLRSVYFYLLLLMRTTGQVDLRADLQQLTSGQPLSGGHSAQS
jgi:hypothetical protein